MSATFTSVIVLEEAIRPGTEDIGFYAQMTAADTRGVTEFEVMQAVCEKLAGREVADEFVNYMLRTANGIGVKCDDFGRLEVFTVDDMRRHHMPKTIYVEVYYPDPECDMPERYADEINDWDDFCHEAYLQDEQTAREAEAQASASELEAEGFTIEDVVDTYYFMYDDAYGCEHTFSFKASYGPAIQLAEELDGDGEHDCLTVLDSDLNSIYPLPF